MPTWSITNTFIREASKRIEMGYNQVAVQNFKWNSGPLFMVTNHAHFLAMKVLSLTKKKDPAVLYFKKHHLFILDHNHNSTSSSSSQNGNRYLFRGELIMQSYPLWDCASENHFLKTIIIRASTLLYHPSCYFFYQSGTWPTPKKNLY